MEIGEFSEKWNSLWSRTPEGAVRAFLIGVIEYMEDRKKGSRMVAMTMPDHYLGEDGSPGRDAFLEYFENEDGKNAKSYLGGTPENGYKCDYDHPIKALEQSVIEETRAKIFVQSGGKDLPSPVHLRRNSSGVWKVFNVSSLATGVKNIRIDDF